MKIITDNKCNLEWIQFIEKTAPLRTYTIFIQKAIKWHPTIKWKKKIIRTKSITSDKAKEIMDLCRMTSYDVSMFWYN